MNNYMLVNCSNCYTPLQPPPGAESMCCAICSAVTQVTNHRATPTPPPSLYTHMPPSLSPSPSYYPQAPGRKRAVIIGISYKQSKHELKGCINDAKCMRYLLINKFHFPQESILLLTEEESDPYRIPTRHNIRMAMYWLVQGCQPGDSLLFHYSGHGSQQLNHGGGEADGYDETLCPVDFETQGMIVDDEINDTLVKPLPHGVKLHSIMDACHSGTALDLPFLCRMNSTGQYVWEDHRPRSGVWKGTSGGEVVSFSGCDDHQTSADTSALSKITSTGAMTFCFIQAIERGDAATYGTILNSMRHAIRTVGTKTNNTYGDLSTLMNMLVAGGSVSGGLTQEPQLTACEPFDVYTKPFSL